MSAHFLHTLLLSAQLYPRARAAFLTPCANLRRRRAGHDEQGAGLRCLPLVPGCRSARPCDDRFGGSAGQRAEAQGRQGRRRKQGSWPSADRPRGCAAAAGDARHADHRGGVCARLAPLA
eukprot:1057762-Prymnesium_polylepis.1